MRFRPSIYSQVQLTSYAPNGGYPGFYGGDEPASAEAQKEKAEADFSAAKIACDSTFDPEKHPLLNAGCVKVAQKAFDAAVKKIESSLTTRLAPTGGGGTPSTGSGSTGTTLKIPSNLTASEKALIDACRKLPLWKQPGCLKQAVDKINADRDSGGGGKGAAASSTTLLWILGGVAVAGGIFVLTRKLK